MGNVYVFFHNKKYICYFEGEFDLQHVVRSLVDAFGYIEEKISCVKYTKTDFVQFHADHRDLVIGYDNEQLVAIGTEVLARLEGEYAIKHV